MCVCVCVCVCVCTPDAVLGDPGGADLVDVLAGVDECVRKGLCDANRVGIAGWSYGGCVPCVWTAVCMYGVCLVVCVRVVLYFICCCVCVCVLVLCAVLGLVGVLRFVRVL